MDSYYKELFGGARDAIVLLELDGRIRDSNKAASVLYGYTKKELSSMTIFDVRAKDDAGQILEQIQAANSGLIYETWHKNKAGQVFPVEVSSKLVAIKGTQCLLSVVRDITTRKEAETVIRRQNENLAMLHDISLDMLGELDLTRTLRKIALSLERLIKGARGYIAILNDDGEGMLLAVGPRRVVNTFIKGEGMIGRVWASGEPLVVPDYRSWEYRLPGRLSRFTTVAGVPIKQQEETVGVLGVYYYRKVRPITGRDVSVLRRYAQLAAVAINNARLHGALHEELAERKRAEAALAASQKKYQMLFDSCQDALFFHELDEAGMPGKFLEVNRAVMDRLGYTREELLGLTPADVNAPESCRKLPGDLEQFAARKTVLIEAVHVAKDGRKIPVEVNAHRFSYNGRPMVMSVVRDISERKRREAKETLVREVAMDALGEKPLEEVLQNACNRIADIFNLKFTWIGRLDADGRLGVYAATEAARQYLERVKVFWDYSRVSSGVVELAIKSGKTQVHGYDDPDFEFWAPVARAVGLVECAAVPLKSREETVGALVLNTDKKAHFTADTLADLETLAGQLAVVINAAGARQHLNMLTEALEAAANGVAIANRSGRFVWANEAFLRITGYSHADLYDRHMAMIGSDQQTRILYEPIWRDVSAGREWRGEVVSRRKDGTLYHEEMTVAPVRSEQGEIVNYITVVNDISERKFMEQELQENRRKVAQAEKLVSLGTLAAGIAHEINQPLNIIKVLADGIKFLHERGKIGLAEMLQKAGEISEQVDRIDGIIRNMRSLVFDKHGPVEGSADLNEAVYGAIAQIEGKLAEHDIALKLNLATIPRVRGDKLRLEEVVGNVVTNAVKALRNNGREDREVSINTFCREETIVLEVRDNGPGIDSAIRDKVFEPFFTTAETGAGMGMGLAIVHAIVTSCGGTVVAGDNEPRGTVIRIELTPA